jgi:hypothetical protein
LFTLPLNDGTYGLGQVITYEPQALFSNTRKTEPPASVAGANGGSPGRSFALNSVVCAFFTNRVSEGDVLLLDQSRLLAVQFVTRDLLDSGDRR